MTEDGSIPLYEKVHWLENNSYRASAPIEVAPGPTPDGVFLPALMNEIKMVRTRLDIVLVIDTSESMTGEAAEKSISTTSGLVNALEWQGIRCALVSFDGEARTIQDLTSDREVLIGEIESLTRSPGSYGGAAIDLAQSVLEASQNDPSTAAAIIFVSDGALRDAERVIAAGHDAQGAGVELVSVGIGLRTNHYLLQQMTSPAGLYLNASDQADVVDRLVEHIEMLRSCLQYDYWGGRC